MEVEAFLSEKYSDREPQGNLEVIGILIIVFFFFFIFWDTSYVVFLRRGIKMYVHSINFLFSHIKISYSSLDLNWISFEVAILLQALFLYRQLVDKYPYDLLQILIIKCFIN